MLNTAFTGKVVPVTGANHGIGAATARAFVAEGAKVCIQWLTGQKLYVGGGHVM